MLRVVALGMGGTRRSSREGEGGRGGDVAMIGGPGGVNGLRLLGDETSNMVSPALSPIRKRRGDDDTPPLK